MTTQSTHSAVSQDSGLPWMTPGAWRVSDGVYRIPLPLPMDGLRAVNVYVLECPTGLTLIDGGWAVEESAQALQVALAGLGYDVRDISHFLVTHVHRDHYTQAVALRRLTGATVSLGAGERPAISRLQSAMRPEEDPRLGHLVDAGAAALAGTWLAEKDPHGPDVSNYESPDEWLRGDDLSIAAGERTLTAIETPGHTQGHYVFADAHAGLLFAGDHVLTTITPSIGFEIAPAANPLGDYLGSLAKLRRRPDTRVLPAHGPVAESTHARIDELAAHHDHRLQQCLGHIGHKALTAHAVASLLGWTRHERPFELLDTFNAVLATLETRAHLELLVARGVVSGTVGPNGTLYAPTGSAS